MSRKSKEILEQILHNQNLILEALKIENRENHSPEKEKREPKEKKSSKKTAVKKKSK